MTDQNAAPAADAAPGPIDYVPPADTQEVLSIDDAMRLWNEPPKEKEDASADDPATPPQESEPEGEDGDQPEDKSKADPAEKQTQEAEPEAELPPIEPPRSWTKEEKEAFAKWPREAQESISRVASTREAEFRRSQNEAAEQRKAFEAERNAVSAEREKYVKNLASQDQALEAELTQKFPNIKTMDDVNFLASEALRLSQSHDLDERAQSQQIQAYLTAWNTLQQKIASVKHERVEAEKRQTQEQQTKWRDFLSEQSGKLSEAVSKDDIEKYAPKAGEYFSNMGFSDEERAKIVNGEKLSPFDHRMQRIIMNAMKYEELMKAPPKAAPKSLPPVQRPGAKQPTGAAQAQSLQALNQKLNATGSVDDAFELFNAQFRRKAS